MSHGSTNEPVSVPTESCQHVSPAELLTYLKQWHQFGAEFLQHKPIAEDSLAALAFNTEVLIAILEKSASSVLLPVRRDVEELAERITGKIQSLLTDKYTNSFKITCGIIRQELAGLPVGRQLSAKEFLERRGLADLSLHWPLNKPMPQIDYASGEAKPTLSELLEAYAASSPVGEKEKK